MSATLEKVQNFLLEKNLLITDPLAAEIAQKEFMLSEADVHEFFAHGPLTKFLNDNFVTEILVNGHEEIWIENQNGLVKTEAKFSSEESLKRYVRRILGPQGKKVDHLAPFADALLEGRHRLHVLLPPISKKGICLSIRKPSPNIWTLNKLLSSGALTQNCLEYLLQAIQDKKNIFLSGGTGVGKTSLLSALVDSVSIQERIIAMEDVAEIRVEHPHFLSLESRVSNQDGEGEISLRRLLRESLRMRPDRIVMGECRGSEALDLLLTLNSGHKGSMGTIHANSPREALQRLETLALLGAENLKQESVRALIAGSVDIVIQLERRNGVRKISAISEVKGIDGSNYMLRDLRF